MNLGFYNRPCYNAISSVWYEKHVSYLIKFEVNITCDNITITGKFSAGSYSD